MFNYTHYLISHFLDKFIGKYVENFSVHNVQTGLYQGDIKLVNLPLKENVLENFTEWPIKVKRGFIGKVILRVPYTRLRSQPWAIILEDIYIIGSPDVSRQMSKERQALNEAALRKELLNSLEAKWWKKIKQLTDLGKEETGFFMSKVASLLNRIVRNIQIKINNIHIRYEDDTSIPNHPFSFGLVIDNVSANSADFDWNAETQTDTDPNVINKVIDLEGLGIYLDTCHAVMEDNKNVNLATILNERKNNLDPNCYIIKPISLHGITKRYNNKLPLIDKARINLQMDMEHLYLQFSQQQFKIVSEMINEYNRFDQQRMHIKNRPSVSIHENPRQWWQFIIKENLQHSSTATEVSKNCKNIVNYVTLYETYLLSSSKKKVFDNSFAEEFEKNNDLDVIVYLREIAMEKARMRDKEVVEDKALHKEETGWLSYFWGSKKAAIVPPTLPDSETVQILEQILPEPNSSDNKHFEEDISKILDEVDEDAVNFFTRDKIFLIGKFSLPSLNIKLIKDDYYELLNINADDLLVHFESRPQFASWCLKASIGAFKLQDTQSITKQRNKDKDIEYGDIITSMKHRDNGNVSGSRELFYLVFEKHPLPSSICDDTIHNRLLIRSEPLKIVHSPKFIKNIHKFFANFHTSQNIRAAAKRHLIEAKIRTSKSLKEMLDKKSIQAERWQISLKISAPCFLFPDHNCQNLSNQTCLLLDLGQLKVTNCNDIELEQYYRTLPKDSTSESVKKHASFDERKIVDISNVTDNLDGDDDDFFFTPPGSPDKSPINFGNSVNNDFSTDQIQVYNYDDKNKLCDIYETYSITMENMMVLIGNIQEIGATLIQRCNKQSGLWKPTKNIYDKFTLIQPCNFQMNLKRKCVWKTESLSKSVDEEYLNTEDSIENMPNIILESRLKKLMLTVSDVKLVQLKTCILSTMVHLSVQNTEIIQPKQNTLKRQQTLTRNVTNDLPPNPEELNNSNHKQISASFILNKFSIQLETNNRPLAELTLSNVELTLVRYNRQQIVNSLNEQPFIVLDMSLYSLVLADARANLGPGLDFIIASHQDIAHCGSVGRVPHIQSDEPLIKFHFQSFANKHHGQLTFSDVSMIANLETITELIQLANIFQLDDNFSTTSNAIPNISSPDLDASDSDVIELEISSSSLSLLLVCINVSSTIFQHNTPTCSKIALASLSDMKISVNSTGSSHIEVKASLKSLNITDVYSKDCKYTNIVSLSPNSDNNSISVTIVQDNTSDSGCADLFVTIPHIVYCHSPLFIYYLEMCAKDLQYYLDQIKNNITFNSSKTTPITNSSNINTEEITSPSLLNGICIKEFTMSSPILVLPMENNSPLCFVVYLGDIEIRSIDEFNISMEFTDAHMISKTIILTNSNQINDINNALSFQKAVLKDDDSDIFQLIDTINFTLNFHRKQFDSSVNRDCIKIVSKIDTAISINVNKQVYEQLLKSVDNLVYDEEEALWNSRHNSGISTPKFEIDEMSVETNQSNDNLDELPIVVDVVFQCIQFNLFSDTTENASSKKKSPILTMVFNDMSVDFIRLTKYLKNIQLNISYLALCQIVNKNGCLISKPLIYSSNYIPDSNSTDTELKKNDQNLSKSCPDLTNDTFYENERQSLFNTTNREALLVTSLPKYDTIGLRKSRSTTKKSRKTSFELPISPESNNRSENDKKDKIVNIKVVLVDKKIPTFKTEYQNFNRFIDANFNELSVSFSLEIWVILLDFLGLGGRFYDNDELIKLTDVTKVLPACNRKYDGALEEIINTKLTAQMKQFNLTIENQISYVGDFKNLACLTAFNTTITSDVKDGNMRIAGSVGDFHLTDLSPTGTVYRHRMFPASNKSKILLFHFFKYGLPDLGLLRNEDMLLSVSISAPIVYVHTQRFLQELNQFMNNFFQYQDRLRDIRVATAGRTVDKSAPRASRIRLEISCDAPILLLPVSAFSDHMVVADLGHLSLSNTFELNSQATCNCLTDKMSIDLDDMDVYTAYLIVNKNDNNSNSIEFPHFSIVPVLPKPLSHKASLKLILERNLDSNTSHAIPDWKINGDLSSIQFTFTLNQYKTIRGMLAHNLGENVDFLKSFQYHAFNTDPRLIITDLSGQSWLSLSFEIMLNDVKVNLQQADSNNVLCSINFLKTKLAYYSYSDSSRTTELICESISLEDLRFINFPANKKPNCFQTILSSDVSDLSNQEQVKITYQANSERNLFDVKLNEMKAVVIFDWLQMTYDWIFVKPYEAISLINDSNNPDTNEFELRAQSYLCSKAENIGCIPAKEKYQSFIKEPFRSTFTSIEAKRSRFFVLENSSNSHSPALVLTIVGIFTYQTRDWPQPNLFGVNVSQLHLVSYCSMSTGLSTPLSIIHPVQMILQTSIDEDANESVFNNSNASSGLVDLLKNDNESTSSKLKVHVTLSAFKLRLSFNDIRLLTNIIQGFILQTSKYDKNEPPANLVHQSEPFRHRWSSIDTGRVNIISSNAARGIQKKSEINSSPNNISSSISQITITHIDNETDFISICLIDDCIDADVPLFDLKLGRTILSWIQTSANLQLFNKADFTACLSIAYYNTDLFKWTSIIQPWPLHLTLTYKTSWLLVLKSHQIIDVDLSSHLLFVITSTYNKWCNELVKQPDLNMVSVTTKKLDYAPFIIENRLGCNAKFRRMNLTVPPLYKEALCLTDLNMIGMDTDEIDNENDSDLWTHVSNNSIVPVYFESDSTARDKIRYNKDGVHYDYKHRIELSLEGWTKTLPITIDKLGIFYRDLVRESSTYTEWIDNKIRIVIEIVRQGTVQNKIILRSAILIHNTISIPLQISLQHKNRTSQYVTIKPHQTIPIPLTCINYVIHVKPICSAKTFNSSTNSSPIPTECIFDDSVPDNYQYSNELVSWLVVKTINNKVDQELTCNPTYRLTSNIDPIHLISTIERLNFPDYGNEVSPGHLITIAAPFTLDNRLPSDLRFTIETQKPTSSLSTTNTSSGGSFTVGEGISDNINFSSNDNCTTINYALVRPGRRCSVLSCSSRYLTNLSVYLESFPRSNSLSIPGDSRLDNKVIICLYDENDKLLELNASVKSRPNGPIYITIYSPYWIMNRTSLPLVFAQNSERQQPSAGYSKDMEKARSPMPFLFSFTNKNESLLLQIRLGNEIMITSSSSAPSITNQLPKLNQVNNNNPLLPKWSQKLSIDKPGTTTIQLRAAHPQTNRPHLCYNVGLEVRPGRGKHHLTNMVILTARYILDNRSSSSLNFIQYQCLDTINDSKPIMALPHSVMTFHWPREDLDPLLAVQKLDEMNQTVSRWSGGFLIDKINSFHVYLKSIDNHKSSQLRITVVQEGAVYRVTFTDVDNIPSPYRLENYTGLQIFFHQDISNNSQVQHHLLPSQTNLAYALDHPTEPPLINIAIEGGTQSGYYLNKTKVDCQSLYYDNFVYLVVSPKTNSKVSTYSISDNEDLPLVFDVPQNSKRVVLRHKSHGARNQLWYYSSENQLFHEGSIAPHDPRTPINRFQENHLLLDISMLAPQPNQGDNQQYQLILAKADPRRSKYQRWFFTEDGYLSNLFGFKCQIDRYMEGAVITSGYATKQSNNYLIHKDFLRPGSGIVNVSVSVDGPTRVVRLIDSEDPELKEKLSRKSHAPVTIGDRKFNLKIDIRGLGIFLINSLQPAEELSYICLQNPSLQWTRQGVLDQFDFQINKLQIDNQLLDTSFPNVIYEVNPESTASSKQSNSLDNDRKERSAFSLLFEREIGHPFNIHVFNFVKARLVPITVILEERLLLKVIQMLTPLTAPIVHKASSILVYSRFDSLSDFNDDYGDDNEEEESLNTMQQQVKFHEGKKVYIGQLQLLCGIICLSVIASDSLTPDLKRMKKIIPSLMSFANAQINIEPYDEEHIFETAPLIGESLLNHLRQQLRSQAIKIFGTVDFLGNPLGFLSDMTSAVRMFYSDQNVKSMVRHIAHGIGDSSAKICGTASKLFSELAMDPVYEEQRQQLFESARRSDSKTATMVAGFKSFLYGVYGGVKSVPSQSYKGYQDEGASGLIMGTMKGVLGIVAKPVGGMFDFANGTAISFREIARSSLEGRPSRLHTPRIILFSSIAAEALSDTDNFINYQNHNLKKAQKILDKIHSFSGINIVAKNINNSPIRNVVESNPTNSSSSSTNNLSITSRTKIESLVGLIPMQISNSNDEIEVLITDCSVYMVKITPVVKILKSFTFNRLSSPPICVKQKDGSIYVKFLISLNLDDKDGVHTSSSSSLRLQTSVNSHSISGSGPLFKCDNLDVAHKIVKVICEAYSDYMESKLTFMTTSAATFAIASSSSTLASYSVSSG